MTRPTILVVDDESYARRFLGMVLKPEGYTVLEAPSAEAASERLKEADVDLVFLDLQLPGEDGLSWLGRLDRIVGPGQRPEVVMITGHGSTRSAVEAMKLGAADYLEKPFENPEAVLLVVQRVMERRRLAVENRRLKAQLGERYGALVGAAPGMVALYTLLERVAPLPVTVLVIGESGTGKELVARTLHDRSDRREHPFLAINCAAIPDNLLEATLFGHEKGAFTGADRVKKGFFEEASGGTLFLDEVGDMSPSVQKGLLRVLQERKFSRLGGVLELPTDVRVVAATHRDLKARVREGLFREDLYYRLAVVELSIPPLRERREDIPRLVPFLVRRVCQRFGRAEPAIDPAVIARLQEHHWPGNVRELENVLHRVVALTASDRLTVADLPEGLTGAGGGPIDTSRRGTGMGPLALEKLVQLPLHEARAVFEIEYLKALLERVDGNVKSAAEMAGIARQHFYRKLADYGIDRREGE